MPGQPAAAITAFADCPSSISSSQCSASSSGRGARRQRVRDRLAAEPGAGQPLRRAGVQLGLQARALEPQARAQQLAEQAVIAVPGALTIERGHEHAVALELLQRERAAARAGEGVGELAGHAVDDARAQQQLAQLRRPAGQHLAHQVVGDRAVVAREVGDERVAVLLAEQREPGEAQAGGPALGALEQARHLVVAQLDAELGEQRRRLLGREREVRRAQLAQPPGQAQPLERELRVRPGRGDDVHRLAAGGDQLAERGEAWPTQLVEVVEHECGAHRHLRQRVGHAQGEVVDEALRGAVEVVERDLGALQRGRRRRPTAAAGRSAGSRASAMPRRAAPPSRRAARSCPSRAARRRA